MDTEVEQLHLQADSLILKFEQEGGTHHIDDAIALDRQALERRPRGHADRSMSLNNLAAHLSTRYHQRGGMEDLNEAITLDREALELRPREHPDRSMSLNNLAAHISTRYNQLGDMSDLRDAIALNQEALDLCPQGHPDRSIYLNNLAVHLSTQYRQLGAMLDLEKAITFGRETLDLRGPGHPNRSRALSNLAVDLSTRYRQLGDIADLDEAIEFSREALELCPTGHPNRSRSLNNYAGPLFTRYTQVQNIEDLEEAIKLSREAIDLRPQGHPDRSISLNNLAGFLSARYKRFEEMTDLSEAIALDQEGLDLRPPGHPDRQMSLSTLAALRFIRYKQLKDTNDLQETITLSREVFSLWPRGHPAWSMSLNHLACRLRARFVRLNEVEDRDELFQLYSQLVDVPQVVSSDHLAAAKAWVDAAEDFRHSTAHLAYETSLRLLVQYLAALPSFSQHLEMLKTLTSSLSVNSLSACLRSEAPTTAVELLELGRNVFWNQLTHLWSPFDDIIVFRLAGKTLTEEFKQLASSIHNALSSPDPAEHQLAQRLEVQLKRVVRDIRNLPGRSRFLLSPLFLDLQLAAIEGPVIIVNASTYSCDALIVLLDQDPIPVPLQVTKGGIRELASKLHALTSSAKVADVTNDIIDVLRELWNQVVAPVVRMLQKMQQPLQSRIWWCPTAEFTLLPLHAAGPFKEGEENFDDLYVSSYTPTLASLILARRHCPSGLVTDRKHIVAIGHTHSKGEGELVSVGAELSCIARRFEDVTEFKRLEGPECCVSQVTEQLGRNQWVHLACHCTANPHQPIEFTFTLHDDTLTLQRLTQCKSENPEFAFVSARHAGVEDEEIPEEMVHAAFAMQSAGFRSVVGTMWAVDDAHAHEITSAFYENMTEESQGGSLDYTQAASALQKTMKSSELEQVPLVQRINYIHVGA